MAKRITRSGLVFLRLQHSDREITFAGLLWIAELRALSFGWVAHKFKAIYGDWPRQPSDDEELIQPSGDLLNWVSNERRKYANGIRRQERKKQEAIAMQASAALNRIEAIMAELEANPLFRDGELNDDCDADTIDLACDMERQMARNICICDWSPVDTTTIDPPHIIAPDPDCPIHRAQAAE